jgi:YD repeat-containing protein
MLAWAPLIMIWGQDKDLENKFFSERTTIRHSKIHEITERVSQYWKNQCVKDSAEIKFKYQFDSNGDLVRVDKFYQGHYLRTAKYSRSRRGDYTQKSYTTYDSLGNEKSAENWVFQFNKNGQRVSEVWVRGSDTVRVNKLTYDRRGNLIEQVANGNWLWRFEYDEKGNLVTSEECVFSGDSMRCNILTKYHYENAVLKRREICYRPGDVCAKQFDYIYDSGNRLIVMKEERRGLEQHGTEPRKVVARIYMTKYEYNDKGNCILESEFRENDETPFRCTYFDYKYY